MSKSALALTSAGNLALLADAAFEHHGEYPSLLFEGTWHSSAELFERSRGWRPALRNSAWRPATEWLSAWPTAPR